MEPTLPAVIGAENLTKNYGKTRALQGLNLHIAAGSVYALVGPNGAGKTTLIQILANLHAPTSGRAWVMGLDSSELRGKALRQIGHISENQRLPEWMTVHYFLDYVRPFYPGWDTALAEHLIRLLDLPLHRKLGQLSRGQRMKAAFASVLPYRPPVIILDEPFSGLDPLVREDLIAALKACDWQPTFLLSSHDLDEIESFATHIGYLDQGRMLFSEELAPLRQRFQRVWFQMPEGFDTPENLPPAWLQFQRAGEVWTFAHAAATSADATRAEVLMRFPDAFNLQSAPMTLREIFLSIARERRLQTHVEEVPA